MVGPAPAAGGDASLSADDGAAGCADPAPGLAPARRWERWDRGGGPVATADASLPAGSGPAPEPAVAAEPAGGPAVADPDGGAGDAAEPAGEATGGSPALVAADPAA